MQYHDLNKLLVQLNEAGLPHTRWWVRKMMKKGLLTLPKYSFNNRFALTDEIISECVQSLRDHGEYYFKEV